MYNCEMSFNETWLKTLVALITAGDIVEPRGLWTKEILNHQFKVDMRFPVLTIPERRLSYKFMAAEAYWILSGDNRVETIAPFNKAIANFSDDGKVFFGAYGPKITNQLEYIIDVLSKDELSRQAVINIWRENPPKTKDVPCTLNLIFNIRDNRLHLTANMRSSDIWLGVPYDVFNFSMVAAYVVARLNSKMTNRKTIHPGVLTMNAVSRHLYETNEKDAWEIINMYLSDGFQERKSYYPLNGQFRRHY